jgi:hypothetical protein
MCAQLLLLLLALCALRKKRQRPEEGTFLCACTTESGDTREEQGKRKAMDLERRTLLATTTRPEPIRAVCTSHERASWADFQQRRRWW